MCVCLFWKYYPVLPVLLGQTASTASRTCFGKRSYPVFIIYIPARAHMLGARVTFTIFVGPYHNIIMCHKTTSLCASHRIYKVFPNILHRCTSYCCYTLARAVCLSCRHNVFATGHIVEHLSRQLQPAAVYRYLPYLNHDDL